MDITDNINTDKVFTHPNEFLITNTDLTYKLLDILKEYPIEIVLIELAKAKSMANVLDEAYEELQAQK